MGLSISERERGESIFLARFTSRNGSRPVAAREWCRPCRASARRPRSDGWSGRRQSPHATFASISVLVLKSPPAIVASWSFSHIAWSETMPGILSLQWIVFHCSIDLCRNCPKEDPKRPLVRGRRRRQPIGGDLSKGDQPSGSLAMAPYRLREPQP